MNATSGLLVVGRGARVWSRVAGQALALALVVAGTFILAQRLRDDGGDPPIAAVAPGHLELLNENIGFWEQRAGEIGDHLSYNKLTELYLQRLRETGDVSDVARAEHSASRSLEIFPDAYSGTVNLALVRVAQHDFDDALALANRAIVARPEAAAGYAVAGDAQMALGQYDAAGENYRRFLDLAPGFDALVRQAALAEIRGNAALTSQFWEAAIEVSAATAPENAAWARVQYGNFLFLTGQVEKATGQFEAAIGTYPGFAAAEAGLGRVAAATGDDDAAIKHYSAAIAKIPLVEYVAALGDIYERAGKTELASQQFALVGAISQLFEANGVRNDLPIILFGLDHGGDPSMLVAQAESAYAARPSVMAADVLAWAYYRAGRFAEASDRADEALALGTLDPAIHYHAGMIALALGDSDRAEVELQAALDLNPEFSVSQSPIAAQALEGIR